ncbi:hypothetical protein P389DRAFT_177854 [Cystobasidium minutum MCA 4210]|uniref:uncharacterized protein n=1 Tax=Cystobasidium minutum MCA 4210 TaxID=1397322 RepID=UPI0034CD318D|eukprot:jgi/Rhomi1/177854/fgenesh1_pg.2_\
MALPSVLSMLCFPLPRRILRRSYLRDMLLWLSNLCRRTPRLKSLLLRRLTARRPPTPPRPISAIGRSESHLKALENHWIVYLQSRDGRQLIEDPTSQSAWNASKRFLISLLSQGGITGEQTEFWSTACLRHLKDSRLKGFELLWDRFLKKNADLQLFDDVSSLLPKWISLGRQNHYADKLLKRRFVEYLQDLLWKQMLRLRYRLNATLSKQYNSPTEFKDLQQAWTDLGAKENIASHLLQRHFNDHLRDVLKWSRWIGSMLDDIAMSTEDYGNGSDSARRDEQPLGCGLGISTRDG